jgi:hypothetical protein
LRYIYYIDGEKLSTDSEDIPWNEISSPDEQTPAYENQTIGGRIWCIKGYVWHRLVGPAVILEDGTYQFWLNGLYYENVHDWLKSHPNQSCAFQVEMLLKYS